MMKHFQVLFGLCIALALAKSVFGGAAWCTPATCGDGPVEAYFQYENCTGEVNYVAMNRDWDTCNVYSTYSYKASFDERGIIYANYYGGGIPNCDVEAENATYYYDLYKFGACFLNTKRDEGAFTRRGGRQGRLEHSAMYGGYMYLHNVNASYDPAVFDNQPIMAYPGGERSCQSPDNCTLDNGQPSEIWYTYYNEYECQDPSDSYFNSKLSPNTCTNYYNYSYYMEGCVDDNTWYWAYFSDAACSQPTQVSVWHTYCSSVTTEQVHCTASRTAIPSFIPTSSPQTQTPTSTASFNPISLLFTIVACSVALLMF